MKIQLSLDRVTIPEALQICHDAADAVDIIEVGTSMIKDFGNASIQAIRRAYPNKTILADSKTIDEGAYEFCSAYGAGADIVTVMGAASITTIAACREVANEQHKDYMIDLLEVSAEKMQLLRQFEDAIFCLHLPADKAGSGLEQMIQDNLQLLQGVSRLAVAGGISLDTIGLIAHSGFEIAVIGGAITKAGDRKLAAEQFRLATKG
ncbi:orotidine 5'-phosphate decarboxylase / HUMPS family protein [Hydrogenoanaerobacterium sp.]|uniref:orotidine 5'-phosphate decarboxylase / HUMPS family protein n=1 Tax=Hydrogenoanaerobacterium sp. TaxID=2953763 RepID=UPI00289CF9DB|nr:orotidine 5'-phosphate decarboxylase / HUMPS family protein [Hydrogenoanaerobacterium sp.]